MDYPSLRIEIMTFDTHQRLFAINSPYNYAKCHSSEGCLFSSAKTCDVECSGRFCVYIHVYQITKNQGPGLYNSLGQMDNRKYFLGLYLTWKWKEAQCFTWESKW